MSEIYFKEYISPNGDAIICQISDIQNTIIYLIAKGECKFWANENSCRPTANHVKTLPEWLQKDTIITDGDLTQRIIRVNGSTVNLEWVNGGYFDVDVPTVLRSWKPVA